MGCCCSRRRRKQEKTKEEGTKGAPVSATLDQSTEEDFKPPAHTASTDPTSTDPTIPGEDEAMSDATQPSLSAGEQALTQTEHSPPSGPSHSYSNSSYEFTTDSWDVSHSIPTTTAPRPTMPPPSAPTTPHAPPVTKPLPVPKAETKKTKPPMVATTPMIPAGKKKAVSLAAFCPEPAPVGKHTEVREYRVVMPLSLEEFEKAFVHVLTEGSKRETGGGGGVEIKTNRPFRPGDADLPSDFVGQKGIYAHKVYHIRHHAPAWIRPFMNSLNLQQLEEDSWNAYPYCRTVIYNPKWKREDFLVTISSLFVEEDAGKQENALLLPEAQLKKRKVVPIDITDDALLGKDYEAKTDPKKFRSLDGKRGPYPADWGRKVVGPRICAYKVITFTLRWRMLETKGRSYMLNTFYPRNLSRMHREAVCSMDVWGPKTLAQLQADDAAAQAELDRLRNNAAFKGTPPDKS